MSSKEKPVQGEAGAWRVRPHDTDLSAARVINDARLAESMAAHRWLVEPLTELPTPAESQPDPWTPSDADYDFNKAWRRGGLGLIELLCGANRETWRRT